MLTWKLLQRTAERVCPMHTSVRSLFLATEIISSIWLFGTDVCKTCKAGFCYRMRRNGSTRCHCLCTTDSCSYTLPILYPFLSITHTLTTLYADDVILQHTYLGFYSPQTSFPAEDEQTLFLTRMIVKL